MEALGGGKPVEEHEEVGLRIKAQDLPQDPLGSGPDGEPFVDNGDLQSILSLPDGRDKTHNLFHILSRCLSGSGPHERIRRNSSKKRAWRRRFWKTGLSRVSPPHRALPPRADYTCSFSKGIPGERAGLFDPVFAPYDPGFLEEGPPLPEICHFVGTKKKELVGDEGIACREWLPEGHPEEVRVYDFIDPDFGKVASYGVCDLRTNTGWEGVEEKTYEAGIKVTDEEWAPLSIERDSFHGEWNDRIKPQEKTSSMFKLFFQACSLEELSA